MIKKQSKNLIIQKQVKQAKRINILKLANLFESAIKIKNLNVGNLQKLTR